MKKNLEKVLLLVLLILNLGFFSYGIRTILMAENKAINIVTEAKKIEVESENIEQSEKSIELYSKSYKNIGIFISIISSLGLIGIGGTIYIKNKK